MVKPVSRSEMLAKLKSSRQPQSVLMEAARRITNLLDKLNPIDALIITSNVSSDLIVEMPSEVIPTITTKHCVDIIHSTLYVEAAMKAAIDGKPVPDVSNYAPLTVLQCQQLADRFFKFYGEPVHEPEVHHNTGAEHRPSNPWSTGRSREEVGSSEEEKGSIQN